MIPALLDWITYRTECGKYSEKKLYRDSAVPIEEVLKQLRPMDIVLVHTRGSFISWSVMYFTNSIWSHAALVSEDGNVIDATTTGAIEHPLTDFLESNCHVAVRKLSDVDDSVRAEGLKWARERIGTPFNWRGVFRLLIFILAGKREYRIRYFFDIVFLLTPLGLLGIWWKPFLWFYLALILTYTMLVSFNIWRKNKVVTGS